MKRAIFTLLTFCSLIIAAKSQDHIINLSGVAFSPNNLTINVGETVQWNNMSGTHNVNGSVATFPSNPEGFSSGNAANAPWSFSHTFNVPGVYQYRCDPHFSLGMTGVITVNGAATGDVVITEINYNNPGTDNLEFIELYNNGTTAVDLQGWTFSTAINYTFPSYPLNPGDYVVIANNATEFENAFGFQPLGWDPAGSNVLNNIGENIVLSDAMGNLVDSVHYLNGAPWPASANGGGPSIVLCDVNSDNSDPANWDAAITPTGIVINNIEILANPGEASGCINGPLVSFQFSGFNVLENAGSVFVDVMLTNGNANATSVTIDAAAASTATNPDDYSTSLPITLTFPAGVASDTQTVTISLVDDGVIEPDETLTLELSNPTNGATIVSGTFNLNISDNDTPLSGALLISGVFDAQPGAAGAKGIELKALQDIPDLSIYGMGSASNGGGTDGEEITLPAESLSEGECVYVAADSALFVAYFGISPIATGTGASINGDDAIELFENGIVIDVFGDISYPSGTGATLPWNYLDGWAYRKDGTGPDGVLFDINHWTVMANALNGGTTNDTAPTPFPVCDYSPIPPMTAELVDDAFAIAFNTTSNLNILANDIIPGAINTLTVINGPIHGTATVNGVTGITYTPDNGYCGADAFTYEVCDAGGCDQAVVTLTIECPITYPAYDIATVTTQSGGVLDSLNVTCELQGTVYGIDLQGVNAAGNPLPAVQFYIHDGTGGIAVFGSESFGYDVQEGDNVIVRGKIASFNCLSEIAELDTIIFVSANNPLNPPAITTFLNESFEAELVQFTNMELIDPTAWNPVGVGFTVFIRNYLNPNADSIAMRIDNDCELFNMPAPNGPFHAIGIGSQNVSGGGGGCVTGYQFLPRYAADIILLNGTQESLLEGKISFYPNPVADQLTLKTDIIIDDVIVANALGQEILQVKKPGNSIDVSQLKAGLYLITFKAEAGMMTSKFVKE